MRGSSSPPLDTDVTQTFTTDASGHYLAGALLPGDYEVTLDETSIGSVLTTPGTYNITVEAGQQDLTADFGVADDELPDTASVFEQIRHAINKPWLPAAVAIGVVALVASVVGLLWFRRRRPSRPPEAQGDVADESWRAIQPTSRLTGMPQASDSAAASGWGSGGASGPTSSIVTLEPSTT